MIKGLIRRDDNGLVLTALGHATIDALQPKGLGNHSIAGGSGRRFGC
jgi:hypothetical protein